jgi:Uma2 family endonuclease
MASFARTTLSFEDYLAADAASDRKLELFEGAVYAMSGASGPHNLLAVNVATLLNLGLRGRPCLTLSSDQRVALPHDEAAYPDVTVVCGDARFGPRHTLLNPSLVVEVLSPGTEVWDRSGKLGRYCALESIRYVLLVAHDAWQISLYARQPDGTWAWSTASAGGALGLDALGVTLPVDEVYANVEAVGGPARTARVRPPQIG